MVLEDVSAVPFAPFVRVRKRSARTGFWSLMSSGSWTAYPEADHIGTAPTHMGAWEKLALGWLGDDLAVATAGQDASFDLGPSESATQGRYQALRVNLPNYSKTTPVFPVDGTDPNYVYSTKGDNIDTSAVKTLAAPVGAGARRSRSARSTTSRPTGTTRSYAPR